MTDTAASPARTTATRETLQAFFADLGNLPASSVMRSGQHFVLSIEGHNLVADGPMLAAMLQAGELDRESTLLRSLLVYEAALQAQLRQSTARCIMLAYAEAIAAGTDAAAAMQECFLDIALACEVEAYVNNQKGLASDIRQVAEYSQAALDHGLDETTVMTNQQTLDEGLHAFTDAVAEARETGRYTAAFDAQQLFFQRSATVVGSDYWTSRAQSRAKDVALMQQMATIARTKQQADGFDLLSAAGLSSPAS
jgi:hypothetical protein